MSPNAGGRSGVAGSQPMSTAVHMEPEQTPYLPMDLAHPTWQLVYLELSGQVRLTPFPQLLMGRQLQQKAVKIS